MSLDEIRRKRMEELMRMQALDQVKEQQAEEAQLKEQISQLERVVKSRMTKEALLRYGTIKAASMNRAVQLLAILGQIIQKHNIQSIDDDFLREVLKRLSPKKRLFTIKKK